MITFGENGCDAPCTTCGRCQVCEDISGQVSMLLTFSDIVTNSTPSGSEDCEVCEDLNVTYELTLLDEVSSVTIVNLVDSICGFAEAVDVNDSTNFCVYQTSIDCGDQVQFAYELTMICIVYRTLAGDLRMLVFVLASYAGSAGCSATVYMSDDFALATGVTQFECLTLDHDGTLSSCSGTDPACGCSVPVAYNLQVGAA